MSDIRNLWMVLLAFGVLSWFVPGAASRRQDGCDCKRRR